MVASTRRASLAAILAAPLASVPAVAATEYAHHRACFLEAWERFRLAFLFVHAEPGTIEEGARSLVMERLWEVCHQIVELPAPKTFDGLMVIAMAAAVMWKGENPSCTQERSAIGLIRAVLSASGTAVPDGFCGFGVESGYFEREDRLVQLQGSLPAWALAGAKAKPCA